MIVPASVDSHVREAQPAANFGSGGLLWLNGGTGGNDRQAFIHFARPFPLGATILSATLRVYLAAAWSGSNTVTARRVTGTWQEARVNWNNRPATSATHTPSAAVTDGVAGDVVEIDVAAMLQAVSDGGAWRGVRLELTQNVDRSLRSSETANPNLRPTLEIEWSEAPQAPDRLAPSGGRAVSAAKPLLTWRFADRLGDTTQASSQVQISDDSEDFSSPEYDSTKVANTESEWDLADTAYAGLADDDVRYWRVKVWDGTDLESAWSDPVEFTRKTHGTLTLLSPGATVDETTPPVTWTFTGRTQEAWEIELTEIPIGLFPVGSAPVRLLYKVPRHPGTETSHTLPPNLIKTGGTYRVVLRVWDTLDRQAMAGDADHVAEAEEFTYERDGGPDPVTALTAEVIGARVLLTWERSAIPDYFALTVDGEEVLDRIDPTDVLEEAGSPNVFALSYWGAVPRVSSTYEVEAVVQDAPEDPLLHSDGNATATAATNPLGIWLADPDDDTAVMIAGADPASLAIGESGTTHYLVAKPAPVRLTDTLRGYEGEVSGTLLSGAERDTFLELKARLKELRLIVGDLSLPVFLEEVGVAPTPSPGDLSYPVSLRFFQSDEFPTA